MSISRWVTDFNIEIFVEYKSNPKHFDNKPNMQQMTTLIIFFV